MKTIAAAIFTLLLGMHCFAQTAELSNAQWQPLFTALESEDWDAAEKLSSKYLGDVKGDDDNRTLARLRYMYLFSAAGKIAAGKMSYDDLEKRVKDFSGKQIFLPARYFIEKCQPPRDFNAVCKSEEKYDLMVTSAAKAATTIHSFEYIKLKEKLDWSTVNGKVGAILGKVESIVPNPNKSRLLIMRIYVSDATVQLRDAPK